MDAAPPSPEPLPSPVTAAIDSNPMTGIPPPSKPTGKSTNIKANKNKKLSVEGSDEASSSTPSACSLQRGRGIRIASKHRNPRTAIGSARQKEADVEALALPLGMSIAAVVAQVLERKNATGETISVDQLSEICTLAVRESLANVFGDRFDLFVRNFEKSFRSTLMTLRLINESSECIGEHPRQLKKGNNYLHVIPATSLNTERCFACSSGVKDCHSGVVQPTISSGEQFDSLEETERSTLTDSINQELALHDGEINQQLDCVPRSSINQSMFSTLEKSVIEQTRSNDLKTFEIGLIMKKLQLKEKQLALHSDLTFLERCKLSMGISKASFKAEKFKNELEETRHAELLKKCIDCLVAGLLIMLASIAYGAYVYSHYRITEATASCTPSEVSKSWWVPKPMASFNSGLQILWCQVQVISRMLFGLLMIVVITYLLLQRTLISTQAMPVTFIILLLGVACGFAGKLCIDTLGGSGYHWFLYWEILCSLHFFANTYTSALFLILHGSITVSQGRDRNTKFPYWIRRFLFYASVILFLPLLCGLVPFAGPGEWKDHFSLLAMDFLQTTSD
ncbi:protein CPR-5 isoform X2 [Actinidia eriantha]|uniref:protein CPR-5 isoform X2 n=1 Tax=Actinidia eriantha TaxID=165200 RepID=UPI00258D4BCC|nr:protein CPR-5 isoform X2 [Actinidia eriantha]